MTRVSALAVLCVGRSLPASLKDYNLGDVFSDFVRDEQGRAHARIEGKKDRLELLIGRAGERSPSVRPTLTAPAAAAMRSLPIAPSIRSAGSGQAGGGSELHLFEPLAAIVNGLNLAHNGLYKELQSIPPGGTWAASFWISTSGF